MIEIKEYNDKYAEEMSKIIIQNLIEINSKDYGMEFVQKSSQEFTVSEIQKNFPKRTKRIIATAVITFVVFMFFVWLGVGMYIYVPQESRGELWPVFGMYAVFPSLIFFFGAKRIYAVLNSGTDEEEEENEEDN